MLMRTDPFQEMDRLSQRVFGTPARPASMPMDAFRVGDHLVVELDLPGVSAESVDVTVQRNVLTVHAIRERELSEQTELLAAERPFGSFSRQLFLGETLDVDRLEADYRDGVLRLRIQVAEQAKPRRVQVQVGSEAGGHAIGAEVTEPALAGG
jgi:HSP20 family protein